MADEKIKFHSVAAVAEMFDVTTQTVRNWIRDNKLVAIKLPSGTLRVSETAVRRLADQKYGE